jgi:7-cyano-7-deazaguanine synthase
MDSTVLLHVEKERIALAVSFNYGSKHNEAEIARASIQCHSLDIEHVVIDLRFMSEHFTSDLLQSGGDIPDGHYEDESMKRTVVPFRNGIMLAIAAGLAESRKLGRVLIANHAGDHAIYPDCRATFIEAMRAAMAFGTYASVKLEAPFTYSTKREIAIIGQKAGVDFAFTYSCYKGGTSHCGTCGTCTERREALQGFDPTYYLNQHG